MIQVKSPAPPPGRARHITEGAHPDVQPGRQEPHHASAEASGMPVAVPCGTTPPPGVRDGCYAEARDPPRRKYFPLGRSGGRGAVRRALRATLPVQGRNELIPKIVDNEARVVNCPARTSRVRVAPDIRLNRPCKGEPA